MGPIPLLSFFSSFGSGDRIREYNYIMGENVNKVHTHKELILDSIALLKNKIHERRTEQQAAPGNQKAYILHPR